MAINIEIVKWLDKVISVKGFLQNFTRNIKKYGKIRYMPSDLQNVKENVFSFTFLASGLQKTYTFKGADVQLKLHKNLQL